MILEGNTRGGAKNLALHLLKEENDHVTVYEVRGFASDELVPALNEAYAISRGTKAKKFLYSMSLNPPEHEKVATSVFLDAIARTEKELGFTGQPRAIVFHEKLGRRHCHVVWSRIDAQKMKAIPVSNDRYKLMDISRDLYRENGWTMPKGFIRANQKSLTNCTLSEWQQAKRVGKNARAIKRTIQDCWTASDNLNAFKQALKDNGYHLAMGRRGFVAVDEYCEVYAIARQVGIRIKAVEQKLGKRKDASLPDVDDVKRHISQTMASKLSDMQQHHSKAIAVRERKIVLELKHLKSQQQLIRRQLKAEQDQRQLAETKARQHRFRAGVKGLWDRVTGKHKQIAKANEREAIKAKDRDAKEMDMLIFQQLDDRKQLTRRIKRLRAFDKQKTQALSQDIEQFEGVKSGKLDVFTRTARSHTLER